MSEDLVLAIIGISAGTFMLGLGFGFIKQPINPEANDVQVAKRYKSQKLFGWSLLAVGTFNIFEVVGVL